MALDMLCRALASANVESLAMRGASLSAAVRVVGEGGGALCVSMCTSSRRVRVVFVRSDARLRQGGAALCARLLAPAQRLLRLDVTDVHWQVTAVLW
jgi:hypothetical protein